LPRERNLGHYHADIRQLVTSGPATSATSARIADLHDEIGQLERRLTELENQIAERKGDLISDGDVAAALRDFDGVSAALSTREQTRLINLLVSRVEYDARETAIEISFHPSGIKALASGKNAANAAVEDAA
jgi:site-specific DNA recombinase